MLDSLSFPSWLWGVCAPAVELACCFWAFGWWSNPGIQLLAREGALGAPDTAGAGTCTASALIAAENSLCQYTVLQWLLSFGIGLSEAKFGSCLSAGSVGGSLPGAPLPAVPAAPERMLWEAIGVSALISRGIWSTQGHLWQGRWEFLFLALLPLCLRWCLFCSLSLGGDFFQDCVTPSLAHPLCCD